MSTAKKHLHCGFGCLLVSLLLANVVSAQITTIDDTTATPVPGSGHDYIHFLSEIVNPANGSLSLRIQLPIAKARGISLPFSVSYDSSGINLLSPFFTSFGGGANWITNTGFFQQGGWSYSIPMQSFAAWDVSQGNFPNNYSCVENGFYTFQDSAGARHALGLGAISPGSPSQPCSAPTGAGIGGDPQILAVQGISNGYLNLGPATIFTDDGTVYNFATSVNSLNHQGSTSSVVYHLPSSIEDRNGNVITINDNSYPYTGINGTSVGFSVIDTVGRTAISANGFGPAGTTNTLTVDGLTYQITWKSTSANWSVNYNPIQTSQNTCTAPTPFNYSETVISSITLPNNTQYHFYYGIDNPNPSFQNPYGLLSEIDYPDGGSVKYQWGLSATYNEIVNYPAPSCTGVCNQQNPDYNGCIYQYQAPVVAARYVSFDGTSTALTQSFPQYDTHWSSSGSTWTTKDTYVNTTDSVNGKTALTIYNYLPVLAPGGGPLDFSTPGQLPQESSIQYFDWASNPLRTVNKTWFGLFDLASQQTVLMDATPNLSSQEIYTYNTSSGFTELQEKDEYDYGASTPTRRTVTGFQQFVGTPGKIANQPCKVVVYDSSGKPASETDYLYDGGSIVCGAPGAPSVSSAGGSSLTGHDATTFSSASTISRGNVTGKLRRVFGGQSPLTKYTYDETGQVTSITDPNGNTTQYSYVDHFLSTNTGGFTTTGGAPPSGSVTNAYLTTVTDPPANGMNLTELYTYGYNNGELTTATDANGQVTTYRYDDSLSRPTETDLPDQGKTMLAYSDVAPNPSVTSTKLINAVTSMQSSIVMDGMGHPIHSQLLTDPDGTTTTDTSYTGTGQVLSNSNPHRSGSSATDGTTTHVYDGIGRPCVVIPPGGTAIAFCPTGSQAGDAVTVYSGNCTTVLDGAGKSRKSCSDAFGRLTGVWEDPSGVNYETDYQYDALDNLLSVTQKGGSTQANWRLRSFTYDSLSRLLSATNPESGTILYSYDLNGNVISKKDARGIQTTMQYDPLNRLLSKTYSDGTPTANFYYDTPPAPWASTEQYTKGRLVEETTGITPEP